MGTLLNIIAIVHEVGNWIIRVSMLLAITRRHRPQSAMVWLLVVFFSPWFGLVLYAFLGSNRLPRQRVERHRRFLARIDALRSRIIGSPGSMYPPLEPAFASTVRLAQRLGHMPVLGGNHADIICDNDAFLDRIIADIDRAAHHVHALYYIFGDDAAGRRFADALIRAERRGVACRLLVDAVGSWRMLRRMAPELARAGVEVFAALPVGFFRRGMARWDLRNHRKLVVIDGQIAFSGSHNLVEPSYGTRDFVWHDLSVRLTGPVVSQLQAVFISDWYFEANDLLEDPAFFPDHPAQGGIAAQVIPSGPNYPTENYQRLLVSALHGAQKHVTITTPYFVPDESLLHALETAALRGVEINLIVPQVADQRLVGAATQAYYEELLTWGINLYLYQPALVHAKTMAIDDAVAFVGTSNFDIRSFALNFEINMVFYSAALAGELRKRHEAYMENSARLELDRWEDRPASNRVFQNVAKLFSPLL
ncbi:MAG: cardiolipin synthase [Candidatus Hydrogenedentales bacterium]